MQAVGHALNEHLTFSILNPTEKFHVGTTSGVVQVRSLAINGKLETIVISVPCCVILHIVIHLGIFICFRQMVRHLTENRKKITHWLWRFRIKGLLLESPMRCYIYT